MNKLLSVIPLVFLLCFTFSCQQGEKVAEEPVVDAEAEIEAIKDWFEKYEANNKAGDFDNYGSFYTEDVVWLPPDEPVVMGKDAILEYVRPLFEQYNFQPEMTVEEIKVAKNFAFARISGLDRIQITRQGKSTSFMAVPFSPESIFAGDQSRDLLYHCLNNKYIIEVYDTSGKLFRKIDRPYEPVPFTSKDAEEYQASYENNPSALYRKLAAAIELPKVKNVVAEMLVDDECKLWIQTNEKKKVEDEILTAFDIFDSNGHYYARIWTEFTSFILKKGKMYRMETDQETGYQTLKRYKVVWE